MHLGIGNPFLVEMTDEIAQIVDVAARESPRARYQPRLRIHAKHPSPLGMTAIGEVGERGFRLGVVETDRNRGLDIGLRGLFAILEIRADARPVGLRHPVGDAPDRATRRETKNQSWSLWGSAMMDREDAEGAPAPMERRRPPL